jgi:hypothetical protein
VVFVYEKEAKKIFEEDFGLEVRGGRRVGVGPPSSASCQGMKHHQSVTPICSNTHTRNKCCFVLLIITQLPFHCLCTPLLKVLPPILGGTATPVYFEEAMRRLDEEQQQQQLAANGQQHAANGQQ